MYLCVCAYKITYEQNINLVKQQLYLSGTSQFEGMYTPGSIVITCESKSCKINMA